MMHCRVDGTAISSTCHPSLQGWRLVICQPINEDGVDQGQPVLAIDPYHAGLHQRVLVTTDGIGTRHRVHDDNSPLRNMVMGILDD
jgi:ethanolamine utilization protein EutN